MRRRCLFWFFLVSGFCGLVDEVVWLRLAMAQYGVVTPLVSTVLSVFMAGLALGSWQGGRLAKHAGTRRVPTPLRLYALAELGIAASAVVVPPLLRLGREVLMTGKAAATWGSLRYHVASGACVTAVLLPFCFAMGATFPLAMAALREGDEEPPSRSFGDLYAANVLGATCGTLLSAFVLIEVLGFRRTLLAAAGCNVAVAASALLLSVIRTPREASSPPSKTQTAPAAVAGDPDGALLALLFATGVASMGMEVVWVRQFTPYLGTVVYAFAVILALYLAATFVGSTMNRRSASGDGRLALAWIAAGLSGLLPLVAADPRLPLPAVDPALPRPFDLVVGGIRVLLGLAPFCGLAGFITPRLVDRLSSGDPEKAGRAYAFNVLGCILGPIVTCFVLLPSIGERGAIAAYSVALLALAPFAAPRTMEPARVGGGVRRATPWGVLAAAIAVGLLVVLATRDYATLFEPRRVRRDYEATVIATEARGRKELLVNGVGITALTPITKVMAHLPMAFLDAPPKSVLVVCFGMGTTFRSALSWDVPTTAVELVPSVPGLFGFYHADGAALLTTPLAHVVVDDGRRYLERTQESFDVITLDPPPPIEAAGSSLLYSRELYAAARRRLRPGGILQQWFPGGDPVAGVAVARAVLESFPEVRAFRSVDGWGMHFLASDRPFQETSAPILAARLPPRAAADLVEWYPGTTPVQVFERILSQEIPPEELRAVPPGIPILTDDRPINEYYLLRRLILPGTAGG